MLDFKLLDEILSNNCKDGVLIKSDNGTPSLTSGVDSFILTNDREYVVKDLPVYIRGEDGFDQTLIPVSYQRNAPYEGRPFLHGMFDCYTLIIDWYRRERNINLLSNIDRKHGWWTDATNESPYLAMFEIAGTKGIIAPKLPGDVIIYNIGNFKAVHGAVVDNDGEVLHHIGGELSKKTTMRYMANKIHHVLRYKNV